MTRKATYHCRSLSTIVLQHVAKNSNHMKFTDLDKAALCSYNHFVDVENQWMKIPNAVMLSINQGSHPHLKKHLSLATLLLHRLLSAKFSTENGHSWKRCSVTLLPLTNINVLTCELVIEKS